MKTLDMQFIRYLNLFSKITKVTTKNCFPYNNMIIFCVSKSQMSKSIGEKGKNVRRISEIIKKNIKIIEIPSDVSEAEKFILAIVSPVVFKSLEVGENEIVINAGKQSKAALIGRNKVRLKEMQEIVKQYFGKELRIA